MVARTIEGLLDKIYFTSGSEAEKGSRFEKLIVAYLQTAGQYAGRFSLDPPRKYSRVVAEGSDLV